MLLRSPSVWLKRMMSVTHWMANFSVSLGGLHTHTHTHKRETLPLVLQR
jgi:hypothetical protein